MNKLKLLDVLFLISWASRRRKKTPQKNKLQSIHLISAKNMRTGRERERPRNHDCIGKELQGLFVMTKLDAKTVIKGDGEEMEI